MKEHGLLAKPELVRAFLNTKVGSWPAEPIDPSKAFKWQTRRLSGLEMVNENPDKWENFWISANDSGIGRAGFKNKTGHTVQFCESKHGPVGRKLYIKETFQPLWAGEKPPENGLKSPDGWKIGYPSTDGVQEYYNHYEEECVSKCSPGIHMPRWASRIDLGVMEIKVERVQDISEEDAKAEGVNPIIPDDPDSNDPHCDCFGTGFTFKNGSEVECRNCDTHKKRFRNLWNSINAAPKPILDPKTKKVSHYVSYPWESGTETREYRGKPWFVRGNPWCFCYELLRNK